MKRISVIMPTYNRAQYLDITLRGMYFQELPSDEFEVIVVNDGSSDETMAVLERHSQHMPNLCVIDANHAGRAHARNLGLAEAAGERVVFLDDDAVAPPDVLLSHASLGPSEAGCGPVRFFFSYVPVDRAALKPLVIYSMLSLDLHAGLSAKPFADRLMDDNQGPFLLPALMPNDDWGGWLEQVHKASFRLALGQETTWVPQWIPWLQFITMHASAPTAALKEVGGFNEQLVGWGEEDVEVGLRMHMAGVTFVKTRQVVYDQMHPRSHADNWAEWYENYKRFVKWHPGPETELRWQFVAGVLDKYEYDAEIGAARRTPALRAQIKAEFDTFLAICEEHGGYSEARKANAVLGIRTRPKFASDHSVLNASA